MENREGMRRRFGFGFLQNAILAGLAALSGGPIIREKSTFVMPKIEPWEHVPRHDRTPLLGCNCPGKKTRKLRKADKAAGRNLRLHDFNQVQCRYRYVRRLRRIQSAWEQLRPL